MSEEILGQQSQTVNAPAISGQAEAGAGGDPNSQAEQTVEINGEQVPLGELRNGYLRQSDYTKKTQELARERETYKPYQELSTWLNGNPDKAARVYEYLGGNQEALNAEIDPLQREVMGLKQTVGNLTRQMGQAEADRLIENINSDAKYEGLFKDSAMEDMLLATHMKKERGANLKETADEIFKVINKLKVGTKQEAEKATAANLNSPTRKNVGVGGVMSPPKDFDPAKASSRDLNKMALEMLS